MAVAVCTVIGQLSKPFSSALYGNGVNFRAVFQSGGMPSTHSAVRRQFFAYWVFFFSFVNFNHHSQFLQITTITII